MTHIASSQFVHPEQTLSTTKLTLAAEAGEVSTTYFDRRYHQLPADWPSSISRFLDGGPRKLSLKPSAASRPCPRPRMA